MCESNNSIKNEDYLNRVKGIVKARSLSLNPRELEPGDDSKTQILIGTCLKYQIDIALLHETSTK